MKDLSCGVSFEELSDEEMMEFEGGATPTFASLLSSSTPCIVSACSVSVVATVVTIIIKNV